MKNEIKLLHGDCLELMKTIPDGSVDLVLTDPPYGTIKGIEKSKASKDCGYRACDWDNIIPTNEMFLELSRILRPNGKALLFSQEPYTSTLIKSATPSTPFLYRAIWYKNTAGNILGAKSAMVNRFEDIVIFSKILEENKSGNPILPLMIKSLKENNKTISEAVKLVGSSATHYFTSGKQFRIPTREKFETLKRNGFFNFDYSVIRETYDEYNNENLSRRNNKYPSIFNLWQGGKSKSNVLEYKKDNDGYHPTQKPVKLLEDLIQTFSNKGDTVLDFTMGSGSTGVACINTGRNFIGVELDEHYFNVAKERINEANSQIKLEV